MDTVLQVALDFVNLYRAMKAAEEAVSGGADWIEAGTPLIKSEGLEAVRALRRRFPDRKIVADMKVMDAGRIEVEAAAKAGANIIDVCGAASDETIKDCIEAARNYGAQIIVDTIGLTNPVERAKAAERMGADYIEVHSAIDEQMHGKTPFDVLREIRRAIKIPLAVAGGINSETAHEAVKAGADIVIVGGAITKAKDAAAAAKDIKRAITAKISILTHLFKRVGEGDISKILHAVSTANISDAMHRGGDLEGILPLLSGVKMVGRAVTVRTYPGDWAKPVEAIDMAGEGDVIVIDAGGVGPAVWGELATHSSARKKLAGVVIDGAIRDADEIRKLKFPSYARLIVSNAGEPKGFGEIGVPVDIGSRKVFSGDWIVGDSDGVVSISKDKAVEIANRAMDVLERENRIRTEIERGGTLSSVMELLRWEKK